MQPLQTCIGPNIRIGQESWCLLYVGFLFIKSIPEQDSREQSITADEKKCEDKQTKTPYQSLDFYHPRAY